MSCKQSLLPVSLILLTANLAAAQTHGNILWDAYKQPAPTRIQEALSNIDAALDLDLKRQRIYETKQLLNSQHHNNMELARAQMALTAQQAAQQKMLASLQKQQDREAHRQAAASHVKTQVEVRSVHVDITRELEWPRALRHTSPELRQAMHDALGGEARFVSQTPVDAAVVRRIAIALYYEMRENRGNIHFSYQVDGKRYLEGLIRAAEGAGRQSSVKVTQNP